MTEFANGMIFVCDENTAEDMFKYQIFGLPLTYLREMKLLVPGKSALFLLEKQTNLVRGIFVPTSTAKKVIVSDIWLHEEKCSYPAQIRFKLHSSFEALPKDSDFSPHFLRRMKVKGKFLDRSRVRSLVSALRGYQNAVHSEQMKIRNNAFPFQADFMNKQQMYAATFASLAFLQQQNELLKLENQVLKVRGDGRQRDYLMRTQEKRDEAFDALNSMGFEKYASIKDFMYEMSRRRNESRNLWRSPPRGPLPFDVNATQHFKHNDFDDVPEWENLPPIPQKDELYEDDWRNDNQDWNEFGFDPLERTV
jgi:hypothetical protein